MVARRRGALAGLALVAAAVWSPALGGTPTEVDCATFGSDCEQKIEDGAFLSSAIVVPAEVCDEIGVAAVRVAIDHSWVGDLIVAVEHEASDLEVMLVDRAGAPLATAYGCPEQSVDAIFADEASQRAEDSCNETAPAIEGTVDTALMVQELAFEPDEATFDIDDCPFERFEGRFLPLTNSLSFGHAGCPAFFDSERDDERTCRFRGRWNDDCGDDSLEVDLERLPNDRFIVRILDQAEAYNFQGSVATPFSGQLTSFGTIADREIDGSLELGLAGFAALNGEACAGTWRLHIGDTAAPNTGRLLGWSVLLVGLVTATPTPTATDTPSATATATATPTATDIATQTPTDTAPPSPTPTATPTGTLLTATASATATATVTGTLPTATASSTATPTSSDTPTATSSATATVPTATVTGTPPTATATATGTATQVAATATPEVVCEGDCDGTGTVSIAELIRAVNIALGNASLATCPGVDGNGDGEVAINELIRAVGNALDGCPFR